MASDRHAPSDPPRFVSALEVARHAGVSRSAVSRAFTPGASIARETRDKVMRAAEELGYHVNDLARGLIARRSRLVGLVVTRPELGFRSHLVASLTRALIRRGSVPTVINTGRTEAELLAAQKTLIGYRSEATIVLSGSPPASFVALARRTGQPVVVIGRSEPGLDHVHIDNAAAAAEAAALFAARGMTRVGLASSGSGTPIVHEREEAFIAAAGRLGLRVATARGADSDYAGGGEAAAGLLGAVDRPQGIFCVNDLVAFGVLDAARHGFGLAVPADLSVIGFDDLPEAAWQAYRLTTFRQDPEEMAAAAIALLDAREADPGRPPARTVVAAPTVLRETLTAAPDAAGLPPR